MNAFEYKNGTLHAEDIPIPILAEEYGTPLFVYSRTHMQEQFRALRKAMSEIDPLICYAVKSNTNASVMNLFASEGAGADVVSGGEIFRALRAGIEPSKIVFAGVGKSQAEIEYALEQDILYFTIESEPEIDRIATCAERLGRRGRIAIRVNPDVDPKTHKFTSTGKKENKFGVDLERAMKAYEHAATLPAIEIAGMHMHIGSPVMSPDPYAEALAKVQPFCEELKKKYETFRHIDIGGGLGIRYSQAQTPPSPQDFAAAVIPYLKNLGLTVGMEPGRFLTGNGGILVTRVEYLKDNPFKKFIVIDAAMNDLIRPPLYEAYHEIKAVQETGETIFGDVVGPICESGDFMAENRDLPAAQSGDLLAIMSAGAYAFTMASNYNSRGRAAEIMVQGKDHKLVRARENWEDLVRGENIPTW